jgi:Aspartyl protease
LSGQPKSAVLLALKGDVQFRRAEMSEAEVSYLAAKKIDPKQPAAYLGLAQLYRCYSLHRKAYDELQIAHQVAPDDPSVQKAWLGTLPRKEKLTALKSYLGKPGLEEEEMKQMTEYLQFLEATVDKPIHACKLVSKVEQTEAKLETIYPLQRRMPGIGLRYGVVMPMGRGLSVKINGKKANLLLDTGASGIIIGSEVADRAGLPRISSLRFGGIGDSGTQRGYAAVADHVQIGDLEFQDCLVSVSERRAVVDGDGLIGANVFAAYLVDIDYPDMRLKLSALPKRPEDKVAPQSLISEPDIPANLEQEDSSTNSPPSDPKYNARDSVPPWNEFFKDRYIAPEMADWTKVYRIGHSMLVPTFVDESKALLFELDTGAFTNILSLRAGLKADSIVPEEDALRVRGLSGEAKTVYSGKATLSFGHLQQTDPAIVILNLSNVSGHTGIEVSGFLGYTMLRLLDVKLDYRDGLVNFEYRPKHE